MREELDSVSSERARLMQAVEQKAEDARKEAESRAALEAQLEHQRQVEAEVRAQLLAAADAKQRLFELVRIRPGPMNWTASARLHAPRNATFSM